MKLKLRFAECLLVITPLVTGSIFAALPTQAATLARADAFTDILNFSQNPESASASVSLLTEAHSITLLAEAKAVFYRSSLCIRLLFD